MNKERDGIFKEMTFPKAAALFVGAMILAGVSIIVINKVIAGLAS